MSVRSLLAILVSWTVVGCASTLEFTVAVGPKAVAELHTQPAAPLEGTKVTLHTDNTWPAADTTRTEEPAQPPPKSRSKGSDAPRVGTILSSLLGWLAGWFN